jgi:hypothetical protein
MALRRHGGMNSARGARKFATEALGTLKHTGGEGKVACRFDSAYCGHPAVSSALAGGAESTRMDESTERHIERINGQIKA